MSDAGPTKRPSLPKQLQLFGEYVIDSLIEEGPTWALYRALHASNESQRFRVRVLHGVDATRRQVVEAFARMAILLESLKHDGIIPVAVAGVDQGLVFIVNAEVPGITLKQRMEGGLAPLEPHEVVRVVREAGAVLEYLHHHQPPIVHRTLDPSKILLTQSSGAVKILEVGYAHAVDEVARVEPIPFAPRADDDYRAPEDTQGAPAKPPVDQYALARIAQKCLAASNKPENELVLVAAGPVLARALSTDPASRYPSVAEFAQAFAGAVASVEVTAVDMRAAPSTTAAIKPVALGKAAPVVGSGRKATIIGTPILSGGTASARPLIPTLGEKRPDATGAYGSQKLEGLGPTGKAVPSAGAPGAMKSPETEIAGGSTPNATLPPPASTQPVNPIAPPPAAPLAPPRPPSGSFAAVRPADGPPRPPSGSFAAVRPADGPPRPPSGSFAAVSPPVTPPRPPLGSPLGAGSGPPRPPSGSSYAAVKPPIAGSLASPSANSAIASPSPSAIAKASAPSAIASLGAIEIGDAPTSPAIAAPPAAVAPDALAENRQSEVPLGDSSLIAVEDFQDQVTSVLAPDDALLAKASPSDPGAETVSSPAPTAAAASATSTAPLFGGPPAVAPAPLPAPPIAEPVAPPAPPQLPLISDAFDEPAPARPVVAPMQMQTPARVAPRDADPFDQPVAKAPRSNAVRIATILGVSVVLASVVYTAGVVLREPLMQLAQGHTAAPTEAPSNPHTTNNTTASNNVSPASLSPTAILPDASVAAVVAADAATHVTAVAPVARDAGTVAIAPNATPDAGTVHPETPVAVITPPPHNDGPRPRRPSYEAQEQVHDGIVTSIASCGVHLGHHAYVRVVYDGATGQASQVEFTGHTLDGNPQVGCIEAAVRAVAMPPFADAHFEMHYTFMLR